MSKQKPFSFKITFTISLVMAAIGVVLSGGSTYFLIAPQSLHSSFAFKILLIMAEFLGLPLVIAAVYAHIGSWQDRRKSSIEEAVE